MASIVIPTFNNASLTFRCVNSIRSSPIGASYEIIVVDDGSRPLHKKRIARLSGVKVVNLPENSGYLRACNSGVAEARGEIIVLLNNDTEVQPGWLDALVINFREPTVGLVGAKLVYPNGTLQEAGGIIFSDGSAANYGRGGDPEDPRYTYRRDVDYCSGAAIAVRRELLVDLGGFDKRYENAYYEDTDLAMSIRSLGYRVIFEPTSIVTHIEHASYSSSVSSLMNSNRRTFAAKWATELPAFASRTQYDKEPQLQQRSGPPRTALIMDDFPRWKSDSGAVRLRHIIRNYLDLNLRVVLVSSNTNVESSYLAEMANLGVQIVNQGHAHLVGYLKSIESDLVFAHVARVHYMRFFMEKIAPQLRNVPLIYDTVDLHFLREERELELSGGNVPRRRALELQKRRDEEIEFIESADVALVVSTAEKQLLTELGVAGDVVIVSNAHIMPRVSPGTARRQGILFVGNFHHRPNVDGLTWFLSEVYPTIQKLAGDVPVTIVGSPRPEFVEDSCRPAVQALGWVDDLAPQYAAARMAIAPLRWGAGVKGKVGEAWSHGVPVVMTDIGAEGMHVVGGETALLANDPKEFADAVLALLNDDDLWHSVSGKARLHVESHFGEQLFADVLGDVIARVNPAFRSIQSVE